MRGLLAILTGGIVARIAMFAIGAAVLLTLGPAFFHRGLGGPALIIVAAALVGGLAAGTLSRRDEIGHAAFAGLLYAVSIGWPARYLLARHHPMLVLLAFLAILCLAGVGGALARRGRRRGRSPATEPTTPEPAASFLGLPRRSLIALGVGFAVADALALAIFLGSRVLLNRFLDGDPPDVRFLHASVAVRHAAAPVGALVGGWLAARLAPARRFGHAAVLGVAIALVSLIGLLAFFHRVPSLDRRLLILVLPVLAAILGGALARPRKEST